MSLYDDHELISFPLVGDDDYAIPEDVLVDLLVHAPGSYGDEAVISSISVTSMMVSLVVSIGGQPAAYVTAMIDNIVLHDPVDLVAIRPGVSGFVVFGAGVGRQRLRLDGTYRLMPECLIAYPDHLSQATVVAGGHSLHGLVALRAGAGLSIEARTLVIRREDTSLVTTLAAVIGTDVTVGADPIPGCLRPAEGACVVAPIKSINGVVPDCAGNLDLVIVNVRETPEQPGLQTVTGPGKIELLDEGTPCGS